jgi:hypothetical protein
LVVIHLRCEAGFYAGKALSGRTGLVPSNFVEALTDTEAAFFRQRQATGLVLPTTIDDLADMMTAGPAQADGAAKAAAAATLPQRRFVVVFDYDPQSMSPNEDYSLELEINAGDILTVHGDLDEDGFFDASLGTRRGVVPHSFVRELTPAEVAQLARGGALGDMGAPTAPALGPGSAEPTDEVRACDDSRSAIVYLIFSCLLFFGDGSRACPPSSTLWVPSWKACTTTTRRTCPRTTTRCGGAVARAHIRNSQTKKCGSSPDGRTRVSRGEPPRDHSPP